jgi:MFS family permease
VVLGGAAISDRFGRRVIVLGGSTLCWIGLMVIGGLGLVPINDTIGAVLVSFGSAQYRNHPRTNTAFLDPVCLHLERGLYLTRCRRMGIYRRNCIEQAEVCVKLNSVSPTWLS